MRGAALFFAHYGSFNPYGWLHTVFGTHPHSINRLREMGVDPLKAAEDFPTILNCWLTHLIDYAAYERKNSPSDNSTLKNRTLYESENLDAVAIIASLDPLAATIAARHLETWNYQDLIQKNKNVFLKKRSFDLNHELFISFIEELTHTIRTKVIPTYLTLLCEK